MAFNTHTVNSFRFDVIEPGAVNLEQVLVHVELVIDVKVNLISVR